MNERRLGEGLRSLEPADGAPRLDADTLAALAAGADLGARHDEVLRVLAGSPADRAALRVLLGMGPASAELAAALAPSIVVPLRRPQPARAQWIGYALAAGLGLLAIGLAVNRPAPTPTQAATPQVVDAPADPADGDRIFVVSYEGELAATGPATEARDDAIFAGAFDT